MLGQETFFVWFDVIDCLDAWLVDDRDLCNVSKSRYPARKAVQNSLQTVMSQGKLVEHEHPRRASL